jgi:hypothetical protein
MAADEIAERHRHLRSAARHSKERPVLRRLREIVVRRARDDDGFLAVVDQGPDAARGIGTRKSHDRVDVIDVEQLTRDGERVGGRFTFVTRANLDPKTAQPVAVSGEKVAEAFVGIPAFARERAAARIQQADAERSLRGVRERRFHDRAYRRGQDQERGHKDPHRD